MKVDYKGPCGRSTNNRWNFFGFLTDIFSLDFMTKFFGFLTEIFWRGSLWEINLQPLEILQHKFCLQSFTLLGEISSWTPFQNHLQTLHSWWVGFTIWYQCKAPWNLLFSLTAVRCMSSVQYMFWMRILIQMWFLAFCVEYSLVQCILDAV